MVKTVYLVKEISICELDNSTVSITKWVNSNELNTGTTVKIIEKRELNENWVWKNEIFTMCSITGEPYAITNDYSIK